MRKLYYIISFFILIITSLLNCSKSISGGGTIETTNGIIGYLQAEDGLPVDGAIVKLIPSDYNPVENESGIDPIIDTTDEKGGFSFSNIPVGKYTIIARQLFASKSFMKDNIVVEEKLVVKIPTGILRKSAAINIELFLLDTTDKKYVYIPGTDIFSYVNSKIAILEDVPSGEFTEIILSYEREKKQNILGERINIENGEKIFLEWSPWKYNHRIILNTTPEGAYIEKNVYNFPLLIRLNNENFDFSKAEKNGKDVIFTKEDHSVLKSEIERWDNDLKKAEIWVLIDTIYGNNSSQSIFMYWGNNDNLLSSSTVLFDTSIGFQGVWHLGEKEGDTFYDVTPNGYNGISSEKKSTPLPSEGIIGNCLYFDGKDDFIIMPNTANSKLNFPENGYYTIYAWVLLDTLDEVSHCIVSKGYEQYYLRTTYISPNLKFTIPYWEFVEFSETEKWQATITPATSKEWSLIVGVRDGNRQILYCNGELMDSTIDKWANVVPRNTNNDLIIGRFAQPVTVPINEGYCFFKGYIDEVRIINKAVSPEWVKLCYMNQRIDDRLLKFEK